MMYSAIPLRDVVVYPGIVTPLFVGRENSIKAIEAANEQEAQIVLLSQKSADVEEPCADDVFPVGTLADIVQIMKLPDGTLKLLVEGTRRVVVDEFDGDSPHACSVTLLEEVNEVSDVEQESFRGLILNVFERYMKDTQKQRDILPVVSEITALSLLCDVIVSHIGLALEKKVAFLQQVDVKEKATQVIALLENEVEVQDLEKIIKDRVKSQMDRNHKEYYLNEQAKAIQKELEDIDEAQTELGKLEAAITSAHMPEVVEQKCLSELEKLKKMPSMSSEAGVVRNYLENMVEYPWAKSTQANNTVTQAQDILQASHYGLEDVKQRIIECIAVQERTQSVNGTILCLVGPPGVGKTSIGKSIAQAVNRKYVRMALGGVRDEAEIRGHRKTYIGAMPGKIVQNLVKSGVNNPLFLLDEIDKMGMDHRGDPASAMLEVLDPEQNKAFNDHYMEVDLDLSNVMFVATANSLNMPEALLDRMEIIRIPGYTESEKVAIAKKYLLPRNRAKNGLKTKELSITDAALKLLVEGYTREAGVRHLDREIGKLCRKVVTEIALGTIEKVSINKNNVAHYAGVARYQRDSFRDYDGIGRINGLAWTSVGGELLNIEVVVLPGKGKVTLTGKLGDVMKESVEAAMTVVKAFVTKQGIPADFFSQHDFHLHLPEAATPKDGPSAGTAMVTALLSAITQAAIPYHIAMTGEVTLQGNVLAIGGLKEKLFAAVREGVTTVFIPKANEQDLAEISEEIISSLKIIPVSHVSQILSEIFGDESKVIEKYRNSSLFLTGSVQVGGDSTTSH